MALFLDTSFVIVSVAPELRSLAWTFFKRHGDKQYSLADCASFIIMSKRRINRALTFDDHFTQAGFTVLPD
jgi:uncharacterized protein